MFGCEMKIKKKRLAAIATLLAIFLIFDSVIGTGPPRNWQGDTPLLQNISVQEAYAFIKYGINLTNMVVLDVRRWADEYNVSHIKGGAYPNLEAINIPYDQLLANLSAYGTAACPLTGHKDDLIIVYCRVGIRSSNASETLVNNPYVNFTNVYNVIGGFLQYYLNTIGNPSQTSPTLYWNFSDTVVINATAPPPTYTVINVTNAYNMATNGSCSIIVDARTTAEYNAQHIVNSTTPTILHAISIPYDETSGTMDLSQLTGNETNAIIVYCQNNACPKSADACNYLLNHGFTKVYDLGDGIDAWMAAGYPTWPPAPSTFSDGFESGSFSAWTGTSVSTGETLEVVVNGTLTPPQSGNYSCHAKCVTGGHGAYAYKTLGSANDTLYMRVYLRFAVDLVDGGGGIVIMRMADSGGNGVFIMRIRKTGGSYVLEVGNYAEGLYYASAPFSIALNTWYCAELQGHVNATAGWFKGLWGGVTMVSQSGKNTGTAMIQRVNAGIDWCWENNASEIYVDSVVVSNNPIGC